MVGDGGWGWRGWGGGGGGRWSQRERCDGERETKVTGLFLHSTVLTVRPTFLRSMCLCYNVLPTLITWS